VVGRSTSNATVVRRSGKLTDSKRLNILFTCVGRRVALIEAFRRAMEQLGVTGRIIATDITSASPAFRKADIGEIAPHVGRLEYIRELSEIVRRHKVGLLVPLTDLDLRSLARQQERLAELGCTVMIGSERTVSLCRDKSRLNSVLRRAGLATIKTVGLKEFYRHPFYPCFVKPMRGSAGVGSGVCHDERELRAHLATYGEGMMIQEFVPGQEFTIDVYRSRDGQVRCVVPRQRLIVRSGEVEKGVTRKDPVLIESAMKLAEALDGIWGVFCCQCRRTGDGSPRFFEVNPRFGGGAPLSIAAGADLPLYLLQEVLGMPITARVGEFTDKLLMLRYDEAVYTVVDDLESLPGYKAPQFR